MTTTLPDPAATPAGDVARARHEVARLAGMPRTWTPSISELLAEEARRDAGHDPQPRPVDTGTDVVTADTATGDGASPAGLVPSLADLDTALDEIADIEAQIASMHARRAELVAHAVRLAELLEHDLVDPADPVARRAPGSRRLELARRAVIAEIATCLHVGEHAAGTLTDHAAALTGRAPATLAALREGRLSWAHATAITKHLADLAPDEAAHVERSVLTAALGTDPATDTGTITCTPAQLARKAARARETEHPTPADVRNADAVRGRSVWLEDGPDGMAWLVAHLPAPLAHAAHDRLTRTARRLTGDGTSTGEGTPGAGDGDHRTLAQARADVLAALLLDDGTLDRSGPGTPRRDADPDDGRPEESHDPVAELLHEQTALATLARSVRPQVTVTVPVLTLLGVTDAPATMDGTVPVDPDTARMLTALAPSLRRILTHPETGTVLSHGRTTYTVPADLKALITTRDTTCRFPGCTHPAARSDLDHTVAWADGGTTDATNLAALCRRHHTVKHQTSWQVRQHDTTGMGGTLEWTSPTGRTHVTRPEPVETTRHRTLPTGHEPPDESQDDESDVPPY